MTALRSLGRIAWRSATRNRLRSLLVVGLIALLVASGTAFATVLRTTTANDNDHDASQFGQGDMTVSFDSQLYVNNPYGRDGFWVGPDPVSLVAEDPNYDTVAEWNAAIENRQQIERDWVASFDHREFTAQLEERFDGSVLASRVGPPGPVGWEGTGWGSLSDIDVADPLAEGILTLVRGRAPRSATEVVITAGPRHHDLVELGAQTTIGGQEFSIVGVIVEPSSKHTAAAVTTPAGFDRVVTELIDRTYRYRIALPSNVTTVDVEAQRVQLAALSGRDGLRLILRPGTTGGIVRDFDPAQSPVSMSMAVTAVLGLQIALVAMAAITVGVRRRTVEFGLLLTTGADDRHVRRLVLAEGLLLGATGALAGAAIGAGLVWWLGEQGWLLRLGERYALTIRWTPLDWAGPAVLGIASSLLAAWWPARNIAKLPVLAALAGHLPSSSPRRRTSLWGLAALIIGTLILSVTLRRFHTNPYDGTEPILAVMGIVVGLALMLGGASVGIGQAISFVGARANALPLKPRLIVRNSDRHRARAWASVAAFVVILGAPVMVAAQLNAQPNRVPNENQVLVDDRSFSDHDYQVWPIANASISPTGLAVPVLPQPPQRLTPLAERNPAELAALVTDFAASNEAAVQEITEVIAVDHTATIVRPVGIDVYEVEPRWSRTIRTDVAIATPELLDALGVEPAARRAITGGSLAWVGQGAPPLVLVGEIENPLSRDANFFRDRSVNPVDLHGRMRAWNGPTLLMSASRAEALGADLYDTGILVVASEPISREDAQLIRRRANSAALDAGRPSGDLRLDVGTKSNVLTDDEIALVVLAGSLALALLIALITAALSAVEVDREIGSMVATGAPPDLRRWLLGGQTAYHLVIAAALAVPLALLIFWAIQTAETTDRSVGLQVPWPTIGLVVVGLPLAVGLIIGGLFRSASPSISRRLS